VFSRKRKGRINGQSDPIASVLSQAIAVGIGAGLFRCADSRRQAIILWGTLHGMLHFKTPERTMLAGVDPESLYMEAVQRFIDGLCQHPASGRQDRRIRILFTNKASPRRSRTAPTGRTGSREEDRSASEIAEAESGVLRRE
jgi:hypothetical protein